MLTTGQYLRSLLFEVIIMWLYDINKLLFIFNLDQKLVFFAVIYEIDKKITWSSPSVLVPQ